MNEERKALIEKLKNKEYVRAFGLMSKDEQECYRKVGIENLEYYSYGKWNKSFCHNGAMTYIISPDYQEPEPKQKQDEYYEIQLSKTYYPEYYVVIDGRMFKLYEIIFMPMFNCYGYNYAGLWNSISLDELMTRLNNGQKSYIKIKR